MKGNSQQKSEEISVYSVRLEKLRRYLDLKAKEFSAELGVVYRTYINYKTQSTTPSADILRSAAAKFGASPRWLLTGEGEMFDDVGDARRGSDESAEDRPSGNVAPQRKYDDVLSKLMGAYEIIETLTKENMKLRSVLEEKAAVILKAKEVARLDAEGDRMESLADDLIQRMIDMGGLDGYVPNRPTPKQEPKEKARRVVGEDE